MQVDWCDMKETNVGTAFKLKSYDLESGVGC